MCIRDRTLPARANVASESLTVVVAFTAGLLSFLSPCVLPLVPSYLTFITGLGLEDASRARRTTLTHALLLSLIHISEPTRPY
mgnify:CR=1 FL=1